MNTPEIKRFHLPTHPMSLIDMINRVALSTGSIVTAMSSGNVDYNGHHVSVSFNKYRGYWITEYMWAGRNVLARGTLRATLQAAKDEHKRGARGGSVSVSIEAVEGLTLDEAIKIAVDMGYVEGEEPKDSWIKEKDIEWKYSEVSMALNMERQGFPGEINRLIKSNSLEEFRKRK